MNEVKLVTPDGSSIIATSKYQTMIDAESFSRSAWEAGGALRHSSTGRTPVLIAAHGDESWVLRHYSRGGFVARFVDDHYAWFGLENTRSFREFRLLEQMNKWQLPVPYPIAARARRTGLIYQADIITRFIPDSRALSAFLRLDGVDDQVWHAIGRMVQELHRFGIDHPDLTAHNILVDEHGAVHIVDFDNAVVRPPGRWRERGVARLERSLRKVAMETGTEFSNRVWQLVVAGYNA